MQRRTAQLLTRGLPKNGYLPGNAPYAPQYTDDPSMPGVGLDNHVGADVTIRHKWAMGQRVANGGVLFDVPEHQRSLRDGPRSTRLEATVTDASGLPTSADAGVAARWKVETLGRTQEEYRIGHRSSAVPANKPKPRMMMCSSVNPGAPGGGGGAGGGGGPSVWKNYLTRVQGSAPDPLVRETKDQRRYAPSVAEEVERMHAAGKSVGKRVRAAEPERPWDKNREGKYHDDVTAEDMPSVQLSDAFFEAAQVPATTVWLFAWVSEWDTQVKIACPWDKKLVVHRCTAELPWVLEQQWHSPEAAQELTKDCIEDFHEMCKTKGYTTENKMECMVSLNGFWAQRRGVLQGLNDMRSRFTFVHVADNTPIPVDEITALAPTPPAAPHVAKYQKRQQAECHQHLQIQAP